MNWSASALAILVAVTPARPSVRQTGQHPGSSGPDSSQLAWVVNNPGQVRDSIGAWLAASAASAADPTRPTRAADLAALYARVWNDSFPLTDIRRFIGWSVAQRTGRVTADSLRRAGNLALGRSGSRAAMRDWRASLRLAQRNDDTVSIAAALGNIGAGWYRDAVLDSAALYFRAARGMADMIGDRRTVMNAAIGLASVSKDQGQLSTAAALYQDVLTTSRRQGDYRSAAAAADNLGLIALGLGDAASALHRHTEALIISRDHGLPGAEAAALLNLGVMAALTGDDSTASSRYAAALALYRLLDDPADQALALHDIGRLQASRAEYRAAAASYRQALTILRRTGPVESAVAVGVDLALVYSAMGHLDEAENYLDQAERTGWGGLGMSARGWLRFSRGDLAFQFNRLPSAGASYRAALALFRQGGDPPGEAAALYALATVRLAEGRPASADGLLESAAQRQLTLGDQHGAAITQLAKAQARNALGDTASARLLTAAALTTLRATGDRAGEAHALCQTGSLERAAGLPLAAEASYRDGIARLPARQDPGAAVCLYGGLGGALRGRGAWSEAITELSRGIATLEAAAWRVGTPGRRGDFLNDKWQLYLDLALAQRGAGMDSVAFETSERLRARQTLELLLRAPGSSRPAEFADSRSLELRRRITSLIALAEGEGSGLALRGVEPRQRFSDLQREALARAQQSYADLLDSLDRSTSRSARSGGVPGWRQVAARLAPDQLLIEYLVSDTAAMAFVVSHDRLTSVDLPVTGRELSGAIDFLRGMINPGQAGASEAWRPVLHRLYDQLIGPIRAAGLLERHRSLLIVPHQELHYLPFAALLAPGSGDHFLVEDFELGSVSSAAVWLRLRQRPEPAALTGVLAMAPLGRELPGASAEVADIGRIYGPAAKVLRGSEATRAGLIAVGRGRAIIHLATLGVLNKHNPLFSFVELAPSGDDGGRLEIHDINGLELATGLVVLSACQTGLGSGRVDDVPPGDDWVGLVQALQSAGAARVMATLWPVDDRATARLMHRFYQAMHGGQSAAAALASAQRQAIRNPLTAGPFYWAAFVMDGAL